LRYLSQDSQAHTRICYQTDIVQTKRVIAVHITISIVIIGVQMSITFRYRAREYSDIHISQGSVGTSFGVTISLTITLLLTVRSIEL